jgi:alpha-1,2-mannosyltransferase
LGIVVVSAVQFVVVTTAVQIHRMPRRTDFATYYIAGEMARDRSSPYDWADLVARGKDLGFTHEQYPFLYPPPFALGMQWLARMPFVRARQVWMLLSTAGLLAALAMTARLIQRQASTLAVENAAAWWLILAVFAPAALNSASVHSDIRLGSVGIFLWLAMTTVALGLLEARSALAGAALAVATVVRLTPAVFVPYLWWRGARRSALVCLALVALGMVLALVHWGPGILVDWWRRGMGPALHRETGWAINQSLDAYLVRLFDAHALIETPLRVSLTQRLLSIGLSLVIAVQTLRVLRVRHRARSLLPLELGCSLLALLAVTKISWVHTLAAMLFVWPVLMLVVLKAAERGAPWARLAGLMACGGFFLSSAHLPILWTERFYHGPWVVLTGAHLLGILVLWGTTCFVLGRASQLELSASESMA